MDEEINADAYYPMFFGFSCAFFALRLVSEMDDFDHERLEIRNRMVKGSAHLLGLLIWRIQKESRIEKSEILRKLEDAHQVINELKKRRSEEAKANEKVVRIIAAREQCWFGERRRLSQHIAALETEMSVRETNGEKSASELREKLKELECKLLSKERLIEEGEKKRREAEERAKETENASDELRECVERETQRHSDEILKHKTAFLELASNQRQLEAEMGHALRQVEAAKLEVNVALERKEESVLIAQRLSMELVRLRKDLEQKDQILSAMLRKSKLDTAEKEMLLKEVRSSTTKRKQAELETAKWKALSELKHERHSLRNMLSKRVNLRSDVFSGGKGMFSKATVSMDGGNHRAGRGNCRCEVEQLEAMKGLEALSLMSEPYLSEGTDESEFMSNIDRTEDWVNTDGEAYKMTIDQRHNLEIDAFAEQLRLKDEKLEALRWQLLSMELESKRLQLHDERLDHDFAQIKHENMKLEALLLDRDAELHSLKEQTMSQFVPWDLHKPNSSAQETIAINHEAAWSKARVIKRKQGQRRQEMKPIAEETTHAAENERADERPANEQAKGIGLTPQYPKSEIQETNVPSAGQCHIRQASIELVDPVNDETSASAGQGLRNSNSSTWKLDIHALGVLYKIKRLKQQLIMLERLTGKQESSDNNEDSNNGQVKGFYTLTSLLNKQIDRYQSLQGKTDDLCQRMDDDDLNLNCGGLAIARTSDETKRLERFLQETFQVQRYVVATGQKLMEVQGKIVSGLVCDLEKLEKPEKFDMQRFCDGIRTLLREVQRGLEVRISRIIGDLESTLACDGIRHFKK